MKTFKQICIALEAQQTVPGVAVGPYQLIVKNHGEAAAQIWAWMQQQEACKSYGKLGWIEHRFADIVKASGYPEETVAGAIIALARNGFARITPKQTVKAA